LCSLLPHAWEQLPLSFFRFVIVAGKHIIYQLEHYSWKLRGDHLSNCLALLSMYPIFKWLMKSFLPSNPGATENKSQVPIFKDLFGSKFNTSKSWVQEMEINLSILSRKAFSVKNSVLTKIIELNHSQISIKLICQRSFNIWDC
jgi:hypothetical protein